MKYWVAVLSSMVGLSSLLIWIMDAAFGPKVTTEVRIIWFLITMVCLAAAGILVIIICNQELSKIKNQTDDDGYTRAAIYRRNQGACMPSPDRED